MAASFRFTGCSRVGIEIKDTTSCSGSPYDCGSYRPHPPVPRPDQTVEQAASLMAEMDVGVLPVGDDDRLIGMITDRDIAVRCVAKGKGPDTRVREIMSE